MFVLGLGLVNSKKGGHFRKEIRQLDFRWVEEGSGKREASLSLSSLSGGFWMATGGRQERQTGAGGRSQTGQSPAKNENSGAPVHRRLLADPGVCKVSSLSHNPVCRGAGKTGVRNWVRRGN